MSTEASKSQILIYQSEDGRIKLDVRFEGETPSDFDTLIGKFLANAVIQDWKVTEAPAARREGMVEPSRRTP